MFPNKLKIYEFSITEYYVESNNGNFLIYKFPCVPTKIIPFDGTYQDVLEFLEATQSKIIEVESLPDFLGNKIELESTISM